MARARPTRRRPTCGPCPMSISGGSSGSPRTKGDDDAVRKTRFRRPAARRHGRQRACGRRSLSLARGHPRRQADGMGQAAERQIARPAQIRSPLSSGLRRHPERDGRDRPHPVRRCRPWLRLQFLAGREPSEGHLAAHDNRRLRHPAPQWDVLLDLDKLAADEHENWVWKGDACAPSLKRCLINLSRGGGDAVVVREFNMETRGFQAIDRDGFYLKEAKSTADYL